MSLQAKAAKGKIDKIRLHHAKKLLHTHTQKGTINKMKCKCTDWNNISANNISHKSVNIQHIQRSHITEHVKIRKQIKKSWAEDLIRYFPRKTYILDD